MKRLRNRVPSLLLTAVCLLTLATAVAGFARGHFKSFASARPDVKITLSGTVERDGQKIPVEQASLIKEGEVIDWTISSENSGEAPAQQYKAVGKIPNGMQLVAGSTSSDGAATVTYSIDFGKSFSAKPTVPERQADGSVKQIPAPVSSYTHVRYEWSDALAQGGKLNASYKVRVK
jgi:uncharacterized repeat protein (TIGR01451 family)